MPHPHGQIYGYSVIPKKLQLEMESCKEHFDETHNCLICDMLEDEMNIPAILQRISLRYVHSRKASRAEFVTAYRQ